MCGIIGFTGISDAKKIITGGLKDLEYRGYDSAGISYFTPDGIQTVKAAGKVSCLEEKLKEYEADKPECGIGHTRWATHGGVSESNCHPHTFGRVTLIHNGIIENYQKLSKELSQKGKYPVSQTDTEIAAMVLDDCYSGNPVKAIKKAVSKLEGSYAFCILFQDQPGVIYAIRKESPLAACKCEEGSIIASDVTALIKYSRDYFVLPQNCIARLTKDDITITNLEHQVVHPKVLHVSWDTAAAKKGGYDYFMLKEIHDQPKALKDTLSPRVADGLPSFQGDSIPDSLFEGLTRVMITACGTAMHAGYIGKNLIEKLTRIPVTVDIASEFRYSEPILDENTLVITISQSGETADTLAALRLSKKAGARTLSIVNVKGSSIARESDYVLYTHAGPEIAVASTKAYTVQLLSMYLLAFHFALQKGTITPEEGRSYMKKLSDVSSITKKALAYDKQVKLIANRLKDASNLFFIGRGIDYSMCMEGSIKLKEISYIHSEAYAAGELKHGTISLITDNVPVIALATQEGVYGKMISNIQEVRSRGAMVILITNGDTPADIAICDHHIMLPKTDSIFTPFAASVILQYIAYYTAINRGLNVDQPRNLAKSVTVE